MEGLMVMVGDEGKIIIGVFFPRHSSLAHI